MRAMGMGDESAPPPAPAAPEPGHDNDNPELDGPAPTPSEMDHGGNPEAESSEGFTAFLPKEITAGKEFKAGDEIVLKITDIDPETGELEVAYAPAKEQETGYDESFDSHMDKAESAES